MTYTLAVVSAGLGEPSSTRLLASRLSAAVVELLQERDAEVLVETVELRPLAHDVADAFVTGFPPPALEAAITTVTHADALIAVTPVFAASYSGLFKSFFDVVAKEALAGKPTLIAATAGTARHSLVLEHAIRPLFAYLRAVVVPTGVFVATDDFGDTASGDIAGRVTRAADELVALITRTPPVRREPADPFDEVTPFERLLQG